MIHPSDHVRVDLHIHSTASDGRWSPEQLVDAVRQTGIGCFAVTDHDSVMSVARAEQLARDEGLRFLRGVEISCTLDGRLMHVLGYGFDLDNEPLRQFLRANEARMQQHSDILIEMLIEAGHAIDLREYAEYAWDRQRGGWKSLNFLIDKGFCLDVRSFFHELFTGDLQVSFAGFPSPAAATQVVRKADGISIWAHPANSLSKTERYAAEDDEDVVAEMVRAGIQGLECYTCHHDAAWTERCLAWARRYKLLVTGGSDSHGGFVGRKLGEPVVHLKDLRLGPLAGQLNR